MSPFAASELEASMKAKRTALPWLAAAALIGTLTFAPAWADDSTMTNPGSIKWGDAPPNMPKGGKLAVLSGDPSKAGPFVMRLMAPAGYKIAPHWHTQNENLTVISGTLYLGMGEKMNTGKAQALKAGGFHYLPGKTPHYAFTKAATVVQVHGEGPFDLTYVNPDDDPQKMAKK
jgi:hypothetical protein